jgi:hypothetical protein
MEDLTNKLNSASLSEASGDAISPSASAEYKDEYVDSTAAEKLQGAYYQASKSAILPLRVPLRLKRTIRCRRDVHQGRMTILTQPKPGPLEGDSSQKVRGTWWVKDSSAIHEVPRYRSPIIALFIFQAEYEVLCLVCTGSAYYMLLGMSQMFRPIFSWI